MINNLELNNYFREIANNLNLINHFFENVPAYKAVKDAHSKDEISLVMEPFTWMPKGIEQDNPMRMVACAFTIWQAVADKDDAAERTTAESNLMAVSDQIYAKIYQDYLDWREDYDFIRYTATDSFEFNFVEIEKVTNTVGVRCDFDLHLQPNFQINPALWS